MSNEPRDSAADLWLNLQARIRKGLSESMPSPNSWRYNPNLDIPRDSVEDHWGAQCFHYLEPVNRLVDDWIQSDVVPQVDPETRYYLCARFVAASRFVDQHVWYRNRELATFLPFPPYDVNTVLRLVLVDWWLGVGQFQVFDDVYQAKLIP